MLVGACICLRLVGGRWAGAGFLAKYCKQTNKLNKLSKKSFEPCLVKVQTLHASCNLQMLASHCCKISCDDNVPCNELMLHNTQILLHGDVFCAQASFFKHTHTCTHAWSFTGMSLNAHVLRRLSFQNWDAFTQRCFHTEALTHTETFLHTNTFTQRWFYIEEL